MYALIFSFNFDTSKTLCELLLLETYLSPKLFCQPLQQIQTFFFFLCTATMLSFPLFKREFVLQKCLNFIWYRFSRKWISLILVISSKRRPQEFITICSKAKHDKILKNKENYNIFMSLAKQRKKSKLLWGIIFKCFCVKQYSKCFISNN